MRSSPFAALTGAEKQIKWLEVQSIRLPYVHGSVDTMTAEDEPVEPFVETAAAPPPAPVKVLPKKQTQPISSVPLRQPSAPTPEPEKRAVPSGFTASDFQKTRHRQYDAVIARMKQAEQSTQQYHPLG